MKRLWLFVGVLIAASVQFILEMILHPLPVQYAGASPVSMQEITPRLLYLFLSETAFALIIGFLYLHVPNDRRGPATGATIGGILGVLIAVYQGCAWYGSFAISMDAAFSEGIKTIILAVLCGLIISATEKKLRRNLISDINED